MILLPELCYDGPRATSCLEGGSPACVLQAGMEAEQKARGQHEGTGLDQLLEA